MAISLFLAENGYNANLDGCGNFTIILDNPRLRGSLTGPYRVVCCLEEGHVLDILVGDSLSAFEKMRLDLFDPASLDRLLALVKRHEQ